MRTFCRGGAADVPPVSVSQVRKVMISGDSRCKVKRVKVKIPLSIIVPTKNESHNLPLCLNSVRWADEIFVIDSGSTDGSIEIAENLGAKVLQFQFSTCCDN